MYHDKKKRSHFLYIYFLFEYISRNFFDIHRIMEKGAASYGSTCYHVLIYLTSKRCVILDIRILKAFETDGLIIFDLMPPLFSD